MGLREAGPSCNNALAKMVEGKSGRVVGTAEMREPEPAHAIGTPGLQDGVRRLVVREVAGGTEDALLERLRVGATQQALAVMVGLDDEQVSVTDGGKHGIGHFAAIDDDADATTGGAEQIATGSNGIVRDGK